MADAADDAARIAETMEAVTLRNARRATPLAAAIGECLHCEEILNDGRRWCDASCRDAWEQEHE